MIKVVKLIALGSLIASSALFAAELVDIDKSASDAKRIAKEDLGNKKEISEEALGLRKTNLYSEDAQTEGVKTDYSRPAPGSSKRFERAYLNAPPMIPHSVDGLLPITQNNNQCLGCHMPDVAKSMGATPIPPTHFTNYRPTTVYKDGKVVKEGKVVGLDGDIGNTGDIKLAKPKKMDKLYQGRFNCSQCHAPQAKVDPIVGNTFEPDFKGNDKLKGHSSLADAMNEGVDIK
jgi:cytochrome c-type protein NapB